MVEEVSSNDNSDAPNSQNRLMVNNLGTPHYQTAVLRTGLSEHPKFTNEKDRWQPHSNWQMPHCGNQNNPRLYSPTLHLKNWSPPNPSSQLLHSFDEHKTNLPNADVFLQLLPKLCQGQHQLLPSDH